MDHGPTPKQTLLLWDVLGRGGSTAQAAVPFKVEAKDREALVRTGFLSTRKVGRALWLTAEDKGWAWADDHLDASLVAAPAPKTTMKAPTKPPASPKIPTLQNWLGHLGAFLKAKGFALADVLPQVRPPEPPVPKARARAGAKSKTNAAARAAPGAHDRDAIEAAVRNAVAALEGTPQRDGVRLSRLRQQLAHIDRAELDQALLSLFQSHKVNLMNLDNPRDIDAERDAAIPYKGQLLQVLWLPR